MDATPAGISIESDGVARCWWGAGDELYRPYHDREWGRPVADDRRLFEKLSLECFMAGLSWLTILRKRENFRAAFVGFEPASVADFGTDDVERLLGDTGIVRPAAAWSCETSSGASPPTPGATSPIPPRGRPRSIATR